MSKKRDILKIVLFFILGAETAALILMLIWNGWIYHKLSLPLIDERPAEELLYRSVSPDGLHSLDVYHNDGKGATIADSAVIIISSIGSGDKWNDKGQWSLYYAYRYSNVTAEWLDNKTIIVHNANTEPHDIVLDIFQDETGP